ncbi:MAG: hypothetical protein KDB00_11265 [Planctomycetales bacterium]|nr:hypothetical protein [Planctomycetales bacterium]
MRNNQRHVVKLIGLIGLVSCVGCATLPPAPAIPAAPPTSAAAGATTIVAVAPPAAPGMTLPQFLGLDLVFGGVRQVGTRVRNRLGTRFPGLEAKPPIRSITDPANTGPDASPAVKAAAEAKAEDDQAPQKAKAIRYLASRGCGECYPDTEDAMIAAMDDCSEVIRYEAVKGLRSSVGGTCQCCRENSCCTPKLLKKLYELAYERNDAGCYLESSARVRRNARLVICSCGGVPSDGIESVPVEGPASGDSAPVPAGEIAPPVAATTDQPTSQSPSQSEDAVEETSQSVAAADDHPIAVVGMVTETTSTKLPTATTAGFVLPADFDVPPQSDNESFRRE